MDFRTIVDIPPSINKIDYTTPVLFTGSCFSSYIGEKFEELKMPVLINPAGTLYNPLPIGSSIGNIVAGKRYVQDDLFYYNGKWISFDHYTTFSDEKIDVALDKINSKMIEANQFLHKAKYLVVTFGTAWVYRYNKTGKIVANCHKLPASEFSRKMLTVDEIVSYWESLLDGLNLYNEYLKVIFTVSPIRHWKDGAHENQLSKSTLLMAIEKLTNHHTLPEYFPAYEIMMDDLRDYRYYADDMLHPSSMAIKYIWEQFSKCYFDKDTVALQREFLKLHKAMEHRIMNGSLKEREKFVKNSLDLIDELSFKVPSVSYEKERQHFNSLLP